jgi:hypothetical protein
MSSNALATIHERCSLLDTLPKDGHIRVSPQAAERHSVGSPSYATGHERAPSRDNVAGSLNSVIADLRREAENLVKLPDYLGQAEELIGAERVAKAIAVAERIASMRLSGAELVGLFRAEIDCRTRLATVEPSPELAAMRWECYGAALVAEVAAETAAAREYAEAVEILYAEETRRVRLSSLPRGMSCGELLSTNFPAPAWIVPGLLVSGLSILAGAPKLGKSWLALAIGAAVGSGGAVLGRYRVERRRALYLALEDTPRRLKNRLEKIGASADSFFDLFTQWRNGVEGIADLDAYLEEHSDIKLVLIDTLARFRGSPSGDDRYAADYAAASSIKTVADRHDCAIVVIHHVRKMASEDIMDTVSGTNGLNGAADSTWVLTRTRGEADASLFITGRDVEEQTLALRFDSNCGSWAVLGDAAEYAQSRERREVLDSVPLEPASRKTKDIVARLDKKPAAVSRLLEKLEAEGLVFSPNYGEWSRRGGKSGNSVKVEPAITAPLQGAFTLLPDLPADRHSPERIEGLVAETPVKTAESLASVALGELAPDTAFLKQRKEKRADETIDDGRVLMSRWAEENKDKNPLAAILADKRA